MKKFNKFFVAIIFMIVLILGTTTVQAASSKKKLSAPKNIKVSISGTSNVKITWSKVKNSSKYTIYRATSKKGKYTKVGSSKSASFSDKKTTRGKTYYYKVVANSSNSKLNSKKSSPYKITVPSKNTALKAIRNALKNKTWVNKNLRITKSCFDEKISSKAKQQMCFTKIKNKEIIVVETTCDSKLSRKTFLVGYYNGKVSVKPLLDYTSHYSHEYTLVSKNSALICSSYMHMGYNEDKYYTLSNLKATIKASLYTNEYSGEKPIEYTINSKKVSKSKFKNETKKYAKYQFTDISTKLTNKNIDKYIK